MNIVVRCYCCINAEKAGVHAIYDGFSATTDGFGRWEQAPGHIEKDKMIGTEAAVIAFSK